MDAEVVGGSGAKVLRYRSREIGDQELRFIRATIERGEGLGRTELAEAICRAWDWRQRNGALSVVGCLDLLRRLAKEGHIELPAPQRGVVRPGRRARIERDYIVDYGAAPVELVPIAEERLGPAELDATQLVVRPIEREERFGWRVYIERYHYLGWRVLVGEHLLYAGFVDGELAALVGWSSAALSVAARDRFIGWNEQGKRERLHLVVNNARFLVLPWIRIPSLASRVLGANLRRLSSDWEQRWKHPVVLAESFVDSSRFRGTCYRASNWKYLGETTGRGKRGNGPRQDRRPKGIFVYELHRRARAILRGEML